MVLCDIELRCVALALYVLRNSIECFDDCVILKAFQRLCIGILFVVIIYHLIVLVSTDFPHMHL